MFRCEGKSKDTFGEKGREKRREESSHILPPCHKSMNPKHLLLAKGLVLSLLLPSSAQKFPLSKQHTFKALMSKSSHFHAISDFHISVLLILGSKFGKISGF